MTHVPAVDRIERIRFDVDVESREIGALVHERLSAFQKYRLPSIVESSIHDAVPSGASVSLASLTIDVGEVPLDDLEQAIEARLRAALSRELRATAAAWSGRTHSHGRDRARDDKQQLVAFVRDGIVGWSRQGGNADFDTVLLRVLDAERDGGRAFVRVLTRGASARRRLARQFSDESLRRIAALLAPRVDWQDLDTWLRQTHGTALRVLGPQSAVPVVWEALLATLRIARDDVEVDVDELRASVTRQLRKRGIRVERANASTVESPRRPRGDSPRDRFDSASELASELASESASELAGELASESVSESASELAGESASELAGESASELAGELASELAIESASELASESARQTTSDELAEIVAFFTCGELPRAATRRVVLLDSTAAWWRAAVATHGDALYAALRAATDSAGVAARVARHLTEREKKSLIRALIPGAADPLLTALLATRDAAVKLAGRGGREVHEALWRAAIRIGFARPDGDLDASQPFHALVTAAHTVCGVSPDVLVAQINRVVRVRGRSSRRYRTLPTLLDAVWPRDGDGSRAASNAGAGALSPRAETLIDSLIRAPRGRVADAVRIAIDALRRERPDEYRAMRQAIADDALLCARFDRVRSPRSAADRFDVDEVASVFPEDARPPFLDGVDALAMAATVDDVVALLVHQQLPASPRRRAALVYTSTDEWLAPVLRDDAAALVAQLRAVNRPATVAASVVTYLSAAARARLVRALAPARAGFIERLVEAASMIRVVAAPSSAEADETRARRREPPTVDVAMWCAVIDALLATDIDTATADFVALVTERAAGALDVDPTAFRAAIVASARRRSAKNPPAADRYFAVIDSLSVDAIPAAPSSATARVLPLQPTARDEAARTTRNQLAVGRRRSPVSATSDDRALATLERLLRFGDPPTAADIRAVVRGLERRDELSVDSPSTAQSTTRGEWSAFARHVIEVPLLRRRLLAILPTRLAAQMLSLGLAAVAVVDVRRLRAPLDALVVALETDEVRPRNSDVVVHESQQITRRDDAESPTLGDTPRLALDFTSATQAHEPNGVAHESAPQRDALDAAGPDEPWRDIVWHEAFAVAAHVLSDTTAEFNEGTIVRRVIERVAQREGQPALLTMRRLRSRLAASIGTPVATSLKLATLLRDLETPRATRRAERRQSHRRGDAVVATDIPVHVEDAGLVLLWPFLDRYFTGVGLLEKGAFVDRAAAERGTLLLRYLAAGNASASEPVLALHKFLCGVPAEIPVPRSIEPSETESKLALELLGMVTERWHPLRSTSVDGFREAFLRREGRLVKHDDVWRLTVAAKPYDMLLDVLPWTISTVRLAWIEPLHVSWRA
jgi:hypothetical protein